ncbi:hypothetical protein K9M42_01050, partial [Patescibacteria group bacterium]|nr:hypothetical protein [Patescibacteria group bacterium]
FEGAGDYFNAIHDVVCELSKHNKDINIYCKKEGYHASIIIVFFRNGNYTKDFLGLILKLKDKLLLYEDIKVVKILPI